jgi:hypothetical protein
MSARNSGSVSRARPSPGYAVRTFARHGEPTPYLVIARTVTVHGTARLRPPKVTVRPDLRMAARVTVLATDFRPCEDAVTRYAVTDVPPL